MMPVDVARARCWHLFHGPLFHTYPHHDAGGLATWTTVRSGYKLWIVIVPNGYLNAKSLQKHMKDLKPLTAHENGGEYWTSSIAATCKRYVVVAQPGTLMYV